MKQKWYTSEFADKKITVMGLGLLGRGIGDTAFLAKSGARLLVTDKKTKQQLQSSLDKLKKFSDPSASQGLGTSPKRGGKIQYRLGGHDIRDFEKCDMVIKAAGVPLNSEYIAHARKNNIPVEMSGALVARLLKQHFGDGVTIVGITGTRGKSTTTALIAHVLKTAGKRVHMGGNVRGVSNLPLLDAVKSGDYVVMELDSWQLQGFGESRISPDIAVFTSFLDDHMNYYGGDVEKYFNDKAQIFLHQNKTQKLFASTQARTQIKKRYPKQKMVVDTTAADVDEYPTHLIGQHNVVNIRLAALVARHVGISESTIKRAIKTAEPEQGRLEYMGLVRGIHVYDDNNATSPDAVIAALGAVAQRYSGKTIHLLCGGAEKQSHLAPLTRAMKKYQPRLYMLSGTGTDRFLVESKLTAHVFDNFKNAIHAVFERSKRGDVFLFSPGFASFGMFVNEYDREDQFKKMIKASNKFSV